MQLYTSPTSPFCRKVEVILLETGLDNLIAKTSGSGTPLSPNDDTANVNPLGKIPVLTREDGPAIYDSRVICRYLNHIADANLYPESRVWEVLTLEATADGIMEAALSMTYEKRMRPEEMQMETWIDAQWTKVAQAVATIEALWASHLSGPLTGAQIALGCALAYVDFRHGTRDWRGVNPGLGAWYTEFSQRPSMVETAPKE